MFMSGLLNTEAVDARIAQNLTKLRMAFEKTRRLSLKITMEEDLKNGREDARFYDIERSAYSEMPICTTLDLSPGANKLLQELGFFVRKGFVVDQNNPLLPPIGHLFYLDDPLAGGLSNVICLTAGQFIDYANPSRRRGEKLEIMAKKAPTLTREFGGDIVALRGTRQEILDNLGLVYLTPGELYLPPSNWVQI